jgi:drug/metabolite transporter (DMT)-like permease
MMRMRSERFLMAAGFCLISIIWGSTWLFIKVGLESVPPFFAVAFRFTIAMVILAVIARVRGERLHFDRDSVTIYLTMAFLSFSIPFALVYWGEQYIGSGLASILFAIYPFVVAIGSHFFLPEEPLNPYKVVGIGLGFVGVLVIFWSDIHLGASATWGMAAVLTSTVLQGTSLVIVKRKAKHMSPTILSLGGMVFGVAILYAIAFTFEDVSQVHLDTVGLGSILYLSTFGTVVTFQTYYWLLKRIDAVYLSLVSLVTPILAVVLGTLVLGELLDSRIFAGAALVLAGILAANGKDLLRVVRRETTKYIP